MTDLDTMLASYDGGDRDPDLMEAIIADLRSQLRLNAGLLARQSDLRMDAESRAMRAEREAGGEPATRMATLETQAARWEWVARYFVAECTLGIHPDPSAFADKLASWPEGENVLTGLMALAVEHTGSAR